MKELFTFIILQASSIKMAEPESSDMWVIGTAVATIAAVVISFLNINSRIARRDERQETTLNQLVKNSNEQTSKLELLADYKADLDKRVTVAENNIEVIAQQNRDMTQRLITILEALNTSIKELSRDNFN